MRKRAHFILLLCLLAMGTWGSPVAFASGVSTGQIGFYEEAKPNSKDPPNELEENEENGEPQVFGQESGNTASMQTEEGREENDDALGRADNQFLPASGEASDAIKYYGFAFLSLGLVATIGLFKIRKLKVRDSSATRN